MELKRIIVSHSIRRNCDAMTGLPPALLTSHRAGGGMDTYIQNTRTEGVTFVGLRGTCALFRRRGRITDRPASAVPRLPYDNRPPSPRCCTVKMPVGAHLLPTAGIDRDVECLVLRSLAFSSSSQTS
jgi:hypothetical protein